MRKRSVVLVVCVVVALALAALLASLLAAENRRAWWVDLGLGFGVTLLLVAPVYWVGRHFDAGIERVEGEVKSARNEATATAEALEQRVTRFEADVDRKLGDVAASVEKRLQEEAARDEAAFEALRTTPTRQGFLEALRRALDLDLIDHKPAPRVEIDGADNIAVAVEYIPAAPFLEPYEEEEDGVESIRFAIVRQFEEVNYVRWSRNLTTEDVMVEVGRAIRRFSNNAPDVKAIFEGFANMFEIAHTDPSRRPIVQVCAPQWVVTTNGIARYGPTDAPSRTWSTRTISERQLRDDHHIASQMYGKSWIDSDSFDEAHTAALVILDTSPF